MVINLFTQYYYEPNLGRKLELDYCLQNNLDNTFNQVYLFYQSPRKTAIDNLSNQNILKIHYIEERPMFNDFFEIMDRKEYAESINVLSNSDIIFTKGLQDILAYVNTIDAKTCIALSRYDYDLPTDTTTPFLRPDSQDTWIFKGNPKVRTSIPYTMGNAGGDNRLAYDIVQHGYKIINPCKSIYTYHIHSSNIRNYLNQNNEPSYRVPTPYHLVIPE